MPLKEVLNLNIWQEIPVPQSLLNIKCIYENNVEYSTILKYLIAYSKYFHSMKYMNKAIGVLDNYIRTTYKI